MKRTTAPVIILGAFLAVFAQFYFAVAGPPCTPPNCPGAIAVDTSNNNVTIGSSTVVNAKLGVVASSADANFYALKVNNANGGSGPLLWIRNDSKVSVATTSFSTTSTLRVAGYIESASGGFVFPDGTVQTTAGGGTSISAANVTAGTFGSAGVGGNYAFPAKLSVGTSTAGTGDLYVVGNVGIGTSSPAKTFHVYANSSSDSGGRITNDGTGGAHLQLENRNTAGRMYGIFSTGSGDIPGGGAFAVYDHTTGGSAGYRLTITSAGSVGIGTSSPAGKLELYGVGQTTSALTDSGNSGATLFLHANEQSVNSGGDIRFGGDAASNWFAAIKGLLQDGTTNSIGDLAFSTRNAAADTALTERMRLTRAGNVGIGTSTPQALLSVGTATTSLVAVFGGGSGKIDAGTIDPIYTIGGERYATYLPAMTGQKEETAGVARLEPVAGGRGKFTIDFRDVPEGSDLWLFGKVTSIKNNFDKLAVLLTPGFEGTAWYEKDAARQTLTIFGSLAGEVSYRLTAPRFDAAKWPNKNDSTSPGFILDE